MKRLMTTILMLGLLVPITGWSGREGGNGGDVFYCENNPELNSFSGDYVLDYIMTVTDSNEDDLVKFDTIEGYISAMKQLLSEKLPHYAVDFANFAKSIPVDGLQGVTPSARYMWMGGSGDLHDIKDEHLIRTVPKNCKFKSQAVVKIGDIFNYDESVFRNLPIERPRQFSFLVVHEWLRTHMVDTYRIRLINIFLHRKSTRDLTAKYINEYLAKVSESKIEKPHYNHYSNGLMVEAIVAGQLDAVAEYLELDPVLKKGDFLIGAIDQDQKEIYQLLKTYSTKSTNEKALKYAIEKDYLLYVNDLLDSEVDYTQGGMIGELFNKYWDKEKDLLVKLFKATEISDFHKTELVKTCIGKDSVECLDFLKDNLDIDFASMIIPAFDGRNFSGDDFDRRNKEYSLTDIDLLSYSAVSGKIESFKYFQKQGMIPQKINVRMMQNYFRIITRCSNCISTDHKFKRSLAWVVDKRIKGLKYYLRWHLRISYGEIETARELVTKLEQIKELL